MRTWRLQEARARFSELVRRAEAGEAQVLTKHGVASVVVLDVATYERLVGRGRSLLDALLEAPASTSTSSHSNTTAPPAAPST